MTIGRFIGGVGILVWQAETESYLLLKRSGEKDFAQGVWEPVTGRVEQGESFEAAAIREVAEETGLEVRLEFILGTTHFYRGAAVPENELIGVIYLGQVEHPDRLRLSLEHTEYRWVKAEEAFKLLTQPDLPTLWSRKVIERAEVVHRLSSPELFALFQQAGFEFG